MPLHINPNDPNCKTAAAKILRRHNEGQPEANITTAVRDFLTYGKYWLLRWPRCALLHAGLGRTNSLTNQVFKTDYSPTGWIFFARRGRVGVDVNRNYEKRFPTMSDSDGIFSICGFARRNHQMSGRAIEYHQVT